MLRSLKALAGYKIKAVDGDIGKVIDFLFDDLHWTTRYLVTDTMEFWDGQVLISPISFRHADWTTRSFYLRLTRDEVKASPGVDRDKPVSHQYDRDLLMVDANWAKPEHEVRHEAAGDPHLRSVKQVTGYQVQGSDGEIGHIEDFIVDEETWTIRYLVIDTSNWWTGKKVLVAPHWATRIRWEESKVYINLTKDEIKNSPTWNPEALVNREYEERLYDYYGRPAYWVDTI